MLSSATAVGLLGVVTVVSAATAWFQRARRVAIPSNRIVFLGLWSAAGALGVASFFVPGSDWVSGIFGGVAVAASAFLLGLYALGKQRVGSAIAVGDAAPAFEAPDDQGVIYSSAALAGSPTLLKFFRGHW